MGSWHAEALVSAAYVDRGGTVKPLDGKAPARVTITAKDVADAETLAQILQDHEDRLATLEREWRPRKLFRRDLDVDNTGTTLYYVPHGFGGRVNWYVARWQPTAAGTEPGMSEDASSDDNTLVLVSGVEGTVTICVEAAG